MTRESESCEGWNSHKTRSVYHFQDSCRWKLASTRIGAIVRQGMSGRVKAYQGISRHTKAYQGISGLNAAGVAKKGEVRCEFAGRKRCVTCSRLTRRDFPRFDQIFGLIGRASARTTSRPPQHASHTHTHTRMLFASRSNPASADAHP
jgi:hypothetical protein